MRKDAFPSLYDRLLSVLPEDTVNVSSYTKATLVHISHTLEEMVISYGIPAVVFTGFQELADWPTEIARYDQLAQVARQVFVFTGKPLPHDTDPRTMQIPLAEDDPLQHEWFLLIVSAQFAVLLCGMDSLSSAEIDEYRECDTILSFEPAAIRLALEVLTDALREYRPDAVPRLQAAVAQFGAMTPNARLMTEFMQKIIRLEEVLNARFRRANRELIEQKYLNALMIESTPAFVAAVDHDDNILLINDALLNAAGYDRKTALSNPFTALFMTVGDENHFHRLLPDPPPDGLVLPMATCDGRVIYVHWYARVIPDQDFCFFTGIDVTAQTLALQSLARSERLLRRLTGNAPDTIFIIEGNDPMTLYCNRSEVMGYSLEEIRANPTVLDETIHPDDRERVSHLWLYVINQMAFTSHVVEYRARTRDGTWVWLRNRMAKVPAEGDNPPLFLSFLTDITEQKQSEFNLRESEERFRLLVESITHHIYMWSLDPDGTPRNRFASPTLEAFTGYPHELKEEDFNFWLEVVIHEADRPAAQAQAQRLIDGQPYSSVEYRIRRANGDIVWVQDSARTVRGEDGSLTVYGVIDDITDRKRAEEALRQQERLEVELVKERELSDIRRTFMTTVSHEFRTPLAVILSSAEHVERYVDRLTREEKTRRLQIIAEQVEHMRRMLDDIDTVLQTETQGNQFVPQPVDVIDLIEQIARQFAHIERYSDRLRVINQLDDPIIPLDPRLMRHILTNLITNALKYSGEQSPVEITAYRKHGYLMIDVLDHGIGIPTSEQAYITEPFYRASNAQDTSGTGLGLKIVSDYVALHGGELSFVSQPGTGTTFTVCLPIRK